MTRTSIIVLLLVVLSIIPYDIFVKGEGKTFSFDRARNEGYIAFVVNEEQKKEEEDKAPTPKCKCNGTEVIVHGDGHKTPCPCLGGNNKCNCGKTQEAPEIKSKEVVEPPKEEAKVEIKPEIKKQEIKSEVKKPRYIVYHFGADWCGPCNQLKKNVWTNKDVQSFFKDNEIMLCIIEEQKPEHKKYFDYYQINAYPTVLIFKGDNLQVPITGFEGYVDSKAVLDLLNVYKKDKK